MSTEQWSNRITGYGEVAPGDLLANPKNFRTHPKGQADALAGVLRDVGVVQDVIVNTRTGHLVDGHLRVSLALRDNQPTIPVKYIDLSEAEEALVLATLDPIAALATTDATKLEELLRDVSTTDATVQQLLDDLATAAGIVPGLAAPGDGGDEFDTTPEDGPTRVQRGDLWQLGQHRLLCGDSTSAADVARLMGGERAALCFTSPPYADQRDYGGGDNSPQALASFISVSIVFCGLYAVNLGISRKDGAVNTYWDCYINKAHEDGLKLLSWNVWDQGSVGSVGKLTAMFPIEHEFIFIFGKKRIDLNCTVPNKDAGKIDTHISDRTSDGRTVKKAAVKIRSHRPIGTVVRLVPQKARNLDTSHPAMFPLGLPIAYIEACADIGDIIYDPFLGSGTTTIAAERTGRRCYGLEIEPRYCDVILRRWEAETGLTTQKVTPEGVT